MTLALAVTGAGGRMGRTLIEAIAAAPDCRLSGAIDQPGSPAIGVDAGAFAGQPTGVTVTADIAQGIAGADVLIDFTRPEGTLRHLAACVDAGVAMVIGTTGLDAAARQRIADAAQRIAIVLSPNMSVGINVMLKLLALAAPVLADGYDVEIIEAHHRHKVDAPSGTALALGETVARALGRDLQRHAVLARQGHTGERDPQAIGFATVRGGDIVGEHTVLFAGSGERIEITHRSSSRANYAAGSLRAAAFLRGRRDGLFDMHDVLGLKGPTAWAA